METERDEASGGLDGGVELGRGLNGEFVVVGDEGSGLQARRVSGCFIGHLDDHHGSAIRSLRGISGRVLRANGVQPRTIATSGLRNSRGSLVPQRFNRVEATGAARGIETEENSHPSGKHEGDDPGGERDLVLPLRPTGHGVDE